MPKQNCDITLWDNFLKNTCYIQSLLQQCVDKTFTNAPLLIWCIILEGKFEDTI